MISEAPDFAALAAFDAQVCVIGGGPVGLVIALDLARRGRRVLVLESGGRAPRAEAQALSEAENLDPATHHAPEITVARRLGGASNLWGGRCLPFDPVDFMARPWLSADLPAWPVGPAELEPWLGPACAWLAAGDPVFAEPLPGVAADPAFGFESLERWSNRPRIQELHGPELAAGPNLLVALGATVTGFEDADGGRIAAVGGRMSRGGAGGGSPRRASCSRPAATRARGSCWRRRRGRPAASATRSGGATWGTSTARSPTSCWRTRPCTPGSTSTSTATAPTCAGGWCLRRRPRPPSG